MVLVDTNILLRVSQLSNPQHPVAEAALVNLASRGVDVCVVPQIIYEFWVVATRPVASNGLGMSVSNVDQSITRLIDTVRVIRDEPDIMERWRSLVLTHEVKGKSAHDARLVAAMMQHGLPYLLTFNRADFARFSGIKLLDPVEVANGDFPIAADEL